MADLHYSIHINAPRNKVWDVMLDEATYRDWTSVFMPGSYYQGDWSEGSTMRFLGPGAEGEKEGGMVAIVKEYRPQEFVSLQYLAEIRDGAEVPMQGTGLENYTLQDGEGGTDVAIDLLNLPDEYAGMFNESWPKALERIKELAEE